MRENLGGFKKTNSGTEKSSTENTELVATSYISLGSFDELENLSIPNQRIPLVLNSNSKKFTSVEPSSFAAKIRRLGINNPVIYFTLSSKLSKEQIVNFLDAGGDFAVDQALVGSPEEDPEGRIILGKILKKFNSMVEKEGPINIFNGFISLDKAAAKIYIDGQKIQLSPYETTILSALIENTATRVSDGLTVKDLVRVVYQDEISEKDRSNPISVFVRRIRDIINFYGFDIRFQYRTMSYKLINLRTSD
jgi:hypothetical protein